MWCAHNITTDAFCRCFVLALRVGPAYCQPGSSIVYSQQQCAATHAASNLADTVNIPSTSGNSSSSSSSDCIPAPITEDAVQCSYYDWKWRSKISYVKAGTSGPPLLLCHGFGVGSYHFDRNVPVLAQQHQVYAVDLLGQGNSWPTDPSCKLSGPLRFSADTWTEQLHHFIQDKIGQPAYIAGNSLGGFLAVNLAARHPEAVRGLVLLNATPFWSSRPPPGQEGLLWKLLQADGGTLPVPQAIKGTIERVWWDRIRQPESIRSLLQLVYANPAAVDDQLLTRILEATKHPAALDAFISILLSPRTELTFDEMLQALKCPVCMAYGHDDPWVVPLWGQRLKRKLPQATYLELTPAGHCPHHEAPNAINSIISTWVAAVEAGQQDQHKLLQLGSTTSFEEGDGHQVQVSCIEGKPRNLFERWDDAAWRVTRAFKQAVGRLTE
eukprot:GHRR01019907.1.p1 GENE.GHRR01019907.1~~GHRR01019907.1.p1  ORF type:complete len:440 (+),score=157.56 GHRR01019907.1:356-1675(+)